jgi:hypothetical protein
MTEQKPRRKFDPERDVLIPYKFRGAWVYLLLTVRERPAETKVDGVYDHDMPMAFVPWRTGDPVPEYDTNDVLFAAVNLLYHKAVQDGQLLKDLIAKEMAQKENGPETRWDLIDDD